MSDTQRFLDSIGYQCTSCIQSNCGNCVFFDHFENRCGNDTVTSGLHDEFEFDEKSICDFHTSADQEKATKEYLCELKRKEELVSLALKMADFLERLAVKDSNGNVCGLNEFEGCAKEMNELLKVKEQIEK